MCHQTNTAEPTRKIGAGVSPNLIKRTSRGSSRKLLENIENKQVMGCQMDQSLNNIMAAQSMKSISTQISQTTTPQEVCECDAKQVVDHKSTERQESIKEDKSIMTDMTSTQLDLIMNDFSKFKSIFKVR